MLASMSKQTPERPQEPIKRRRGRPPKNNKLADAFPTLTLQFETSPDSTSPTAESNSNKMMKIGEPDAFVPLMKVSPSVSWSKKRKRKMLATTAPESPSKKSRPSDSDFDKSARDADSSIDDTLLTPMSIASNSSSTNLHANLQVNPKTLENLSFVTDSDHHSRHSNFGNYHTLASSSTSSSSSSRHPRNLPLITPPHSTFKSYFPNEDSGVANPDPSTYGHSDLLREALAPSQLNSISEEKEKEKEKSDLLSFVDDGLFLFQLVVDERGRAALSNKDNNQLPLEKPQDPFSVNTITDPVNVAPIEASPLDHPPPHLPRLVHAHTAIGIEALHRKLTRSKESVGKKFMKRNLSEPAILTTTPMGPPQSASLESESNVEKLMIPQTPKSRFEFGSGYTPFENQGEVSTLDGELAYNLTPQFNAMMYSMMNIDSPQQKRATQSAHSFLSPQVDLSQSSIMTSPQVSDAMYTKDLLGTEPSPKSASTDEGDARTALRKAFNRRK